MSVARRLITGGLVLVAAGAWGCAESTTTSRLLPPPPGEAVRLHLGQVGLAAGRYQPTFEVVDGPARGAGAGAGRGALLGALAPIVGGVLIADGYGLVAGIMLAPVGALIGSVIGAIQADPAAKIAKLEAGVSRALADAKLHDELVNRVIAIGREQTPARSPC